MSGADIIAVISTAVEAIGVIKRVWDAIKDANGLPAAFRKVRDELPLVEDTLGRAGAKAGSVDPVLAQPIMDTVTECGNRVQELKGIFQKIKASRDTGRPVKKIYHDIVLPLGKGHRVEELMRDILEGVKSLAANQVFQLAAQVDELQRAIDALAEVEPSVLDHRLQSGHHQNIQGGTGFFNVSYGDGDTFQVADGGVVQKAAEINHITNGSYNSTITQHFMSKGESERRIPKYLSEINPRAVKNTIHWYKADALKDSCRRILDHRKFVRWRDGDARLLWIKGDPGRVKTMLLCGIIDELEPQPDTLLSYFLCQANDPDLNKAINVLRGLIYMLISEQPSLFRHAQTRFDGEGTPFFSVDKAWGELCTIFTAMLLDGELQRTYLIIDALDECVTDLDALLKFIFGHTSSRVKWIVSSRNPAGPPQRPDFSQPILSLDLEEIPELVSQATALVAMASKMSTATMSGPRRFDTLTDREHHILPKANSYWRHMTLAAYEIYENIYEDFKDPGGGWVRYNSFADQFVDTTLSSSIVKSIWDSLLPDQGNIDGSRHPKGLAMAALYMLHLKRFRPELKPPKEELGVVGISERRRSLLKGFGNWVGCHCKPDGKCAVRWNFVNDRGLHRGGEPRSCPLAKVIDNGGKIRFFRSGKVEVALLNITTQAWRRA